MTDNLTPLGEEINKHLRDLKWSQRKLALQSNITRGAISKLMRGKTKPTPETINAIADALGIDAAQLMRLAGIPLPPVESALDPAALYIAQQLTKLPKVPRTQAISAIQGVVDAIYEAYHIAPSTASEQFVIPQTS